MVNSQTIGVDKQGEIYFVEFSAKTEMKRWGTTNEQAKPEYEKWQNFAED